MDPQCDHFKVSLHSECKSFQSHVVLEDHSLLSSPMLFLSFSCKVLALNVPPFYLEFSIFSVFHFLFTLLFLFLLGFLVFFSLLSFVELASIMAEFPYYSILNHFSELDLLIFLFAIMLLDLKSLYTLLFCHWSIVFRLTSTLIWKSSQCVLTDDLDCSNTYP